MDTTRAAPDSSYFIIELLNQVKAKNIIENSFFIRTNKPVYRNPLDLPLFNDFRPVKRRSVLFKKSIEIVPFYTHINHVALHHKGYYLKDYLALDQETVLVALHEVVDILKNINDSLYFDLDKIFGALKYGFVEQRRAGVLFSGASSFGESSISLSVPFYYVERNYQLTAADKKALEEEFGVSTQKEQDRFKKNHLISDKIGIGDLRININLPLSETWKDHLELVFLVTMPIGGAFVKGIAGSAFVGSPTVPVLDANILFDLLVSGKQEEVFQTVSALGLDALDSLSATLLEQSLTNERHFSLGFGFVNKLKIKDFFKHRFLKRWYWNYSLTCEYVIPSKHHRSFISKIDKKVIDSLDLANSQNAANTLQTFTQEALDRFFLRSFRAKIHPGVVVRSYSTFIYNAYKKWHFWIGSDLWFKSAEKVVFLDASAAVQASLDRPKVKNSYGLALSTLVGLSYKQQKEAHTLEMGLTIFSTYCARGVGKEMGIALKLAAYF
ncbi:hypothetical protein EKK58_03270 [Candidatus Dependentiae bacterium]|nr:MAG: hypothetical protein EKK58_03270 [Candidatus Dependentiae bacterium]